MNKMFAISNKLYSKYAEKSHIIKPSKNETLENNGLEQMIRSDIEGSYYNSSEMMDDDSNIVTQFLGS